MTKVIERCLERGILPDAIVRAGIRRLLRKRLRSEMAHDPEASAHRLADWIRQCDDSSIAESVDAANRQHYEIPASFFQLVLGKHQKYSCGLWNTPTSTLDEAEDAMLVQTCKRAGIQDGMRVLDLGCGWGSMSLWVAQQFPNCHVVGVSNSSSQRDFILGKAKERGLLNIDIITADVNELELKEAHQHPFDRIVSIEMMEHTRNWRRLLERAAGWLHPNGRMFVHVFTHKSVGYEFVTRSDDDWMARHFFTGGQMPADSQLLHFQDHLQIESHWRVSGQHYQRTADAWLRNLDANRDEATAILRRPYGQQAAAMTNLWRVFFLSCSELWGFEKGSEWLVSHYLMRPRTTDT